MKPADFKFKYKHPNRRFLLLCIVGVVVVAWWAWVAGPIHTKSAIKTGQNTQAQSKLNVASYNSQKSASSASSSSSTPVSAAGSASPVTWPPTTQPSNMPCHQPAPGIQPDYAVYPCGCGVYGATYPCCPSNSGVQMACPESTY